MRQSSFSISRLQATPRSLNPGTVRWTTSNCSPCPGSGPARRGPLPPCRSGRTWCRPHRSDPCSGAYRAPAGLPPARSGPFGPTRARIGSPRSTRWTRLGPMTDQAADQRQPSGWPGTPPWCGTGSPRWPPTRGQHPGHGGAGRGPRADRRGREPLLRRHLVAVGDHARPPRARARRRRGGPAGKGGPLHAAGQREPGGRSSSPRRWPRWCRSTTPTSCSPPTARWPSSRPSRSPSSTGSTGVSPAGRQFLALGDAYHGDTVGALSLGDGGFGTELFDPLRFPVLRTPGYGERRLGGQGGRRRRGATPTSLAAVVIEPLVQGASGMLVAEPDDLARFGRACRDHGVLLICDEVATGFGRTGQAVRLGVGGPTPAGHPLPGQGDHRRLPAPVGHRGLAAGLRRLPGAGPRAERPSTTATPTAGTPWPARWPCGTCSCSTNGRCWPTCVDGGRAAGEPAGRPDRRPARAWPTCASGA